jgi:3-hydroxyacyl-CoA dehydrogenase
MNYENITVAGSGVLGVQIAFQTAYKGFHVNVYDISEDVLRYARAANLTQRKLQRKRWRDTAGRR